MTALTLLGTLLSTSAIAGPLDGTYVGAGVLAHTPFTDNASTALSLEARYAPSSDNSLRPYGWLMFASAGAPDDDFRNMLVEFEMMSEDEAAELKWRNHVLSVQGGVELDILADLFLRGGIGAVHFSSTEDINDTQSRISDWSFDSHNTTETRAGLFAAIGKRVDLDNLRWEPSFNVSHYLGLAAGGEGTLAAGTPPDGTDKPLEHSGADFASGQTMFAFDNHLNIGPIAATVSVAAGTEHSDKYSKDMADEFENSADLNPRFYVLRVAVGYEFGN